jgi:hypothetical protein
MGKNPLGKRVMGTHCHQDREELLDPPDLGSTMAADRDVFLEN